VQWSVGTATEKEADGWCTTLMAALARFGVREPKKKRNCDGLFLPAAARFGTFSQHT
jgi:hypothetical protein